MKKLGYKKVTIPEIKEPVSGTSGIPALDNQTQGLTHFKIIKHT